MTKALIVEDNELNLELIQDILDSNNIQWISAQSGERAIELLQTHAVDLILMDLQLPDMDGFATLLAIDELLGEKAPPAIAVTGNAMEADKRRCIENGFSGFLRKPYRIHNLLQAIAECLTER